VILYRLLDLKNKKKKEKKSKEKAPLKRLYDNLNNDVEIIEKPEGFNKSAPPPKLRKTSTIK
jgi:hypothetical protein